MINVIQEAAVNFIFHEEITEKSREQWKMVNTLLSLKAHYAKLGFHIFRNSYCRSCQHALGPTFHYLIHSALNGSAPKI